MTSRSSPCTVSRFFLGGLLGGKRRLDLRPAQAFPVQEVFDEGLLLGIERDDADGLEALQELRDQGLGLQ